MRIGFFTDDYFPRKDGAAYTVKTWKEKLEERGHEVHIIYPGTKEYEPQENEHPVPGIKDPYYMGHYVALPTRLKNLPDLDVYHVHTPFTLCWEALYRSRKTGASTVFTLHTPLEFYIEETRWPRPIKKGLNRFYLSSENYLLKKFDAVTMNSDRVERDVETVNLPVGIDTDFFQPSDFEPDFEFERPVIGRSGRVSEEKNIEYVLELAEEFEGTVVIAGEGRARDDLEDDAPENVVFHDFFDREDLPGFLSWLDVFVTASEHDTLNLTHLEACACGTPVVAPRMTPFTETVKKENGELYKAENIEQFHQKVLQVLDGDYDPRTVALDFSVDKTVEKLEDLYEELEMEKDGA